MSEYTEIRRELDGAQLDTVGLRWIPARPRGRFSPGTLFAAALFAGAGLLALLTLLR